MVVGKLYTIFKYYQIFDRKETGTNHVTIKNIIIYRGKKKLLKYHYKVKLRAKDAYAFVINILYFL